MAYKIGYCSYMEQAAMSRNSLTKAKFEELRSSCEDRSREVLESQAVLCSTCLAAKGETEMPAASMGDSEVGPVTGSESPASRTILVDNVSVSTGRES